MYLPIIMLRHWGWPGFWVFAIPNVLGCAGFGYLCSKAKSEALCRDHAGAMVAFSAVTVAYQLFFAGFVGGAYVLLLRGAAAESGSGSPAALAWADQLDPALAIPAVLAVVALLLGLLSDRWWPWLGALATGTTYVVWTELGLGRLAGVASVGDATPASLLLAAPIIAFGFLFCPWLDRTFHRARQQTTSVHAFGVFGASFFVAILMTCAYGAGGRLDLSGAVVAHLATQLLFTTAVHLREIRIAPVPVAQRTRQLALVLPIVVGVVSATATALLAVDPETAYFLFLGCYGLVFPGYVLLFMTPDRWLPLGMRRWSRTPRRLALYGLLVLVLAPLAAKGFIDLWTWLLPIPLVVLVLALWTGDDRPDGTRPALEA
jgi:hypothetical protein